AVDNQVVAARPIKRSARGEAAGHGLGKSVPVGVRDEENEGIVANRPPAAVLEAVHGQVKGNRGSGGREGGKKAYRRSDDEAGRGKRNVHGVWNRGSIQVSGTDRPADGEGGGTRRL